MNTQIEQAATMWPAVQEIFSVPHSEKEYERLVALLDGIVDEVGEDEAHPLASLMETLGSLVTTYESNHLPDLGGSPLEVLTTLMGEHGLKQSELQEIGSQGVVSEILSGRRSLNIRQIKKLSKKFHVSPAVFL